MKMATREEILKAVRQLETSLTESYDLRALETLKAAIPEDITMSEATMDVTVKCKLWQLIWLESYLDARLDPDELGSFRNLLEEKLDEWAPERPRWGSSVGKDRKTLLEESCKKKST
jgi:hypothetical protein